MTDQASTTKQCRDCGSNKPITEFYRSAQMRDGHSNSCKTCTATMTKNAKRHGYTRSTRIAAFQRTGKCLECESLPWRRSKPCCPVCAEPYSPESTGSMRAAVLERRKYVG